MNPQPIQLNDFQRNALQAGFRYIDRLLGEALAGFAPANDDAVFAPTFPDATPVQRKVIGDQTARLRRTIRAALDACAVPVTPPEVGALWNLRCTITSIQIALDEMGPAHLRGYGGIDAPTADAVEAALAQIRSVLVELNAYLVSGLGGDLSARLARLDQTRDEVRLLREIERIVAARGLVELRGAVARLLDRLERNWWTVAFIGRVSSGKSSLLNRLLATGVLPTGVTPITAVPIRIVPGRAPAATVFFATEKPRKIATGELGEFASEERNPGNVRQVTDLLVELPAERLAGDVCFVDTPGLGSLATAGAAQTLAFLPRCDLGVLLLDAATTPGEDDIAVARALLENGAEVLPVLSKADLLMPSDRDKMLAYTGRQFAVALGCEVPVAAVSVMPGHELLLDRWAEQELAPRQIRHRELATVALRRKTGALREGVTVALSIRLGRPPSSGMGTRLPATAAALSAARAAIERLRNDLHDLAYRATPDERTAINTIAGALAGSAHKMDGEAGFRLAIAGELGRMAARIGAEFDGRLRRVRDTTAQALAEADGRKSDTAVLLPPEARPLFDPAPLLAPARLSLGWRRWPASLARSAALRSQLESVLGPGLGRALQSHAQALVAWSQRYLEELAMQFNAQAGLTEAQSASGVSTGEPVEEIRRDLEILRQWNARPTPP